jgi:hypothetical protein
MSKRYENEQAKIAEGIKRLKTEIDKKGEKEISTDIFLAAVRKYTRIKKLTPRMLNELIDKIEVHHAEKHSGEHIQKLTIHYNCVGAIEIPEISALPDANVRIQTRRGVAVNYTGSQRAV